MYSSLINLDYVALMLLLMMLPFLSCTRVFNAACRGGLSDKIKRLSRVSPVLNQNIFTFQSKQVTNMLYIIKRFMNPPNQAGFNIHKYRSNVRKAQITDIYPLNPKFQSIQFIPNESNPNNNTENINSTISEEDRLSDNNIRNISYDQLAQEKKRHLNVFPLRPIAMEGMTKWIEKAMSVSFLRWNNDESAHLTNKQKLELLLTNDNSENVFNAKINAMPSMDKRLNIFEKRVKNILYENNNGFFVSAFHVLTFGKYVILPKNFDFLKDSFYHIRMTGNNKYNQTNRESNIDWKQEKNLYETMIEIKKEMEEKELSDVIKCYYENISYALDELENIGFFLWNFSFDKRMLINKKFVYDVAILTLQYIKTIRLLPNQEVEVNRIENLYKRLKTELLDYIEYEDGKYGNKYIFEIEKLKKGRAILEDIIK